MNVPSLRPAALLAAAALCACKAEEPKLEPLTASDREALATFRHFDPKHAVIKDKGTLFVSLDQNLRKWRELSTRTEIADVDQRASLSWVLTGQVYYNFDAILAELEHGTDAENRRTAAGALGFSRIPEEGEPNYDAQFPPVHHRAVKPLLAVLEEGQDELAINSLLSLALIAAPETPRELMVELMLKHHHAEVRQNAAYVLSRIAKPADAALLVGPLFSALNDPEPHVRLAAVAALERIGDRQAQAPLLERLRRDDTPLVQARSALALAAIGDLRVINYLIEGLRSDAQVVAFSCHHALVRMTKKNDVRGYTEWRDWWTKSDQNPDRPRS